MATAYALPSAPYQGINSGYKRACLLSIEVSFSSGSPTVSTANSDTGFTVSGAAGAYTGTMPKSARGKAWGQAFQATADGAIVNFTAFSATAGTFSFETQHGDTTSGAEALSDGDKVWLFFLLEGG